MKYTLNAPSICFEKKNFFLPKFCKKVLGHFIHSGLSESFRVIYHLIEEISLYKTIYMAFSVTFIIKVYQVQNLINPTVFFIFFLVLLFITSCISLLILTGPEMFLWFWIEQTKGYPMNIKCLTSK